MSSKTILHLLSCDVPVLAAGPRDSNDNTDWWITPVNCYFKLFVTERGLQLSLFLYLIKKYISTVEDISVPRNKNCCADVQQWRTGPIHYCTNIIISKSLNPKNSNDLISLYPLQVVVCQHKSVSWSYNRICCGKCNSFIAHVWNIS